MKAVPMTPQGQTRLSEELEHLKHVERPRIIEAISEARAHGDLKENAEYHAAREQQGFTEGRIRDLESKLANAQIIDVTKMTNEGKVIFGATVTVLNTSESAAEPLRYQIVGEDEADFKMGKISVASPLARAMIGKEEGDVVEVAAPQGARSFEIVSVEYI